jgi:hypothetical protein
MEDIDNEKLVLNAWPSALQVPRQTIKDIISKFKQLNRNIEVMLTSPSKNSVNEAILNGELPYSSALSLCLH